MGLDPYNPQVIPRSFWQKIRKIWPKKPSDFKHDGYYYTHAEALTRPKWGWSRTMMEDGKPWKMIFRVTAVTDTYVYYQGLMWNPPISRKKLPRVITPGKKVTNNAGYTYHQGRVVSRGWKSNPFGKFGCEPGYGTSKFSWAVLRGWKPSAEEEPTVRRSRQADSWKMTGVLGYDERQKLLQEMFPHLKHASRSSWYSMPWWKIPMQRQLEYIAAMDQEETSTWWDTTPKTPFKRAIEKLEEALTGPGYTIGDKEPVNIMNYPFDDSFIVEGQMTIDAFSKVWKLPAPKKTYEYVVIPYTGTNRYQRNSGFQIVEK